MFWLGVSAAYLVLLGVGLFLGHWLAGRRGRDGGIGDRPVAPPAPAGPSHGLHWAPLGSEFDRAFLPAAFVGDALPQPA